MTVKTLFNSYVLQKSLCLYAHNAHLIHSKKTIKDLNTDTINNLFNEFIEFDKACYHMAYDGFTICFDKKKHTADNVIDFGANLLFFLSKKDKGEAFARKMINNIDQENWWYQFGKTRYFILCFSNCYPKKSPRYVSKSDLSFFMFQPVHSFDRKSKPVGTTIPQQTRVKIREHHNKCGKAYDHSFTNTLFEGQKIFHGLLSDYVYNWNERVDI